MSTIKVNNIESASGGGVAAKLTSVNGGSIGTKNLIINGAMLVAQRSGSSTAQGYQTLDRVQHGYSGHDEVLTFSQANVASGTTPYTLGFRKCFKITNGNQTSGAGASDYVYLDYALEGQDVAGSGWNYNSASSFITFSFWIKSSVAQSFKGYFITEDGTNKSYAFDTGSLSADTWTKVTKTIPGNSNLTINNDNGRGMSFSLWPYIGTALTDSSVTENAWITHSGSARTKDATSTWWTTNNATFEVTGFQLEVGSVATDFEHRSFGQELQLCKRYYQAQRPYYNAAQYLITNEIASNTTFFNPEMRTTPTVTHETLSCRENSDSFVNVSVSSNYLLDNKGINYVVTKTGAAVSDSFIIFVNNAKYDAEL